MPLTLLCIDFALPPRSPVTLSVAASSSGRELLDILLRRQNKKAAMKFFRKLLKGLAYVLRAIITDKLKTYGTVKREILFSVEHRQ